MLARNINDRNAVTDLDQGTLAMPSTSEGVGAQHDQASPRR
jgi:hypothetical protein